MKVKVSSLKPGDVVLVRGERCAVKEVVMGGCRDALRVRLHGRAPLEVAWNATIEKVDPEGAR